MKKFTTTIVFFILTTSVFAQNYYRYQNEKINLEPVDNLIVVQQENKMVSKTDSQLEGQLSKGEIDSFQKMRANLFRLNLSLVAQEFTREMVRI